MSFAPYETVYGSPLLDEIHNYFPALLYAPDEFSNIRDVLYYVQEQTRSRYDLFSYGRRRYREAEASRVPAANSSSARTSYAPAPPASVNPVHQQMFRPTTYTQPQAPVNTTLVSEEYEEEEEGDTITTTFRITETTPQQQRPRQGQRQSQPTSNPATSLLTSLLMPPTQEETRAAQLLLSLLGQPVTRTSPQFLWNQFFQPVTVRPSAEQIRQFTTLGQVPSEMDVCPVCQDTFETNRQGRRLNACGHWFHQTCIDTWFERNVRCPVCRHDIRTPASPILTSQGQPIPPLPESPPSEPPSNP